MRYDHIAAIFVLNDTGGMVLQLRDDKLGIANPNRWGMFGGRIEDGETWTEAAAREVSEELTLPATAADLTWFGAFQVRANCTFYTYVYRPGRWLEGAVLTEGQSFRHFTVDEVATLVNERRFAGHDIADSAHIVLAAWLAHPSVTGQVSRVI